MSEEGVGLKPYFKRVLELRLKIEAHQKGILSAERELTELMAERWGFHLGKTMTVEVAMIPELNQP